MPPRPPRRPGSRGPDLPVSSCDCKDCRAACNNSPGWFTPDEVPRLAEHLGLTVEETFRRHLGVGVTRMADNSLRHGVMPHKLRDGKKPGSVWSLPELAEPGRCVFFDRGRCTIYKARPSECARMIHNRLDMAVRLRRTIVKLWTPAALAPFAKLTGERLFGESRPAKRVEPRPSKEAAPRGAGDAERRGPKRAEPRRRK